MFEEYLSILADNKKSKQEETWEWSNPKNTKDQTFTNDISSLVNITPHVNIGAALKKFNGYELNSENTFKIESGEEKLARIRREIKELERDHSELDGVEGLGRELELALIKGTASGTQDPISDTKSTKPSDQLNLESRITKLENALGQDTLSSQDLFTQVETVNRKLSFLDPNNMQILEQKISNISMKMNSLQKHTLTDSQISKLNDMEKLAGSLRDQVPIIPVLSERLCSLKEAHQQVCTVLNQEVSNSAMIEKLQVTLKDQKRDIENLENIVVTNSGVIKENLKVLEQRMEKFC